MDQTSLSIWLAPSLSLVGVILGFIATAIFNHSAYTKQIKLLEKETEKRFEELKKQKKLDQQYALLDKSLAKKQEEIDAEIIASKTYTELRLEFVRLSAIVREVLGHFETYTVLPSIKSDISKLLCNPNNVQQNIITHVLDVQIYLEIYNRDGVSNAYRKENLEKLKHVLSAGNNDCFEAMSNSLLRVNSLNQEYAQRILKFNEDGTILM